MDVTVAYATTVRPFDETGLRALADADTVVIVEPYLAGTSIRLIDDALTDRPHRTLGLGVARTELRRYGTADRPQPSVRPRRGRHQGIPGRLSRRVGRRVAVGSAPTTRPTGIIVGL